MIEKLIVFLFIVFSIGIPCCMIIFGMIYHIDLLFGSGLSLVVLEYLTIMCMVIYTEDD